MVSLPLLGTTVVDLTRFVSGSFSTMILGALGARVIKIEVPPSGDPYRGQGRTEAGGGSTLFESVNRGKESVVLDFRKASGSQALESILAGSDFLVHNARPGSMARYGLDFESIHQRHPWIIHASISAFGDVGPQSGRGGFDLIVQAESGVMSVTGSDQSGPAKVGTPMLDIGAGLATVTAVLAAHTVRLQTGVGAEVSSSLLEFAMASFTTLASDVIATGDSPPLLGSHSSSFAPYGGFRARDDSIVLAGAGSEHLWRALCEVIGRSDLLDDPRFVNNSARVANRESLTVEIETELSHADVDLWLERFDEAGIPAGRVRPLRDVLGSAQVQALDIIRRPVGSGETAIPAVDPPFRIDGERARLDPAPSLGANTRQVLSEFGVAPELVDRLTS